MISLLNFKQNIDSYIVLLMMEKSDTIDMLPTAQRPLSPQNYRVMTNYGVPALGSLAINYATQEQYIYGVDGWSEATPEAVLGILNAIENKTYVPEEGMDGYNKVIVNVPQLDTSDATAAAGDILSPKTAYVDGEKVTGTLEVESGTGTPKASAQTINPSADKLFDKFTIAATPLDTAKTVTPTTSAQTINPSVGNIGLSSVTVSAIQTQIKDIDSVPEEIMVVKPDAGKYLTEVTVNPVSTMSKTVTPSSSSQTVLPDSGSLLSMVEVNATPLDASKEVTAGTADVEVAPTGDNIGIVSVTVHPTPSSAKTVIPTKSLQSVAPENGKLLSSVTVNAIPDEYIVPTGSQTITTNGTINVSNLASVVVNVPNKTSEITITENGVYEVKTGEVGYSKITVNVQASSGE